MKPYVCSFSWFTLLALSCFWFSVPFALSDEPHNKPLPAAESSIQPALPSAGYILTRSRGRAMVRHGLVPCQPRCCNNLTPSMIAVQAGNTEVVVLDNAAAAPHVEDPEHPEVQKELIRMYVSPLDLESVSTEWTAILGRAAFILYSDEVRHLYHDWLE